MNETHTINIVTQVAEEKSQIMYKPFFYANQIFIVAEQLIRRIEHIASFSFGILTPSGEILQIDPSLNWILFSIFISQMNQYGNYNNIIQAPALSCVPILQHSNHFLPSSLDFKNTGCEPMDTTPAIFSCTRSTSSTELTSQNVTSSYGFPNHKKYVVLDLSNSKVPLSEVIKNINESTEECFKLNAREQLKLKKSRFGDGFL